MKKKRFKKLHPDYLVPSILKFSHQENQHNPFASIGNPPGTYVAHDVLMHLMALTKTNIKRIKKKIKISINK